VTALAYGGGDSIWIGGAKQVLNTLNGGGDGSSGNWAAAATGVIALACDPLRPEIAYGVIPGRIYRFGRTGSNITVSDITGNFPSKRVIKTIAVKPGDASDATNLFIGTDAGVFASFDLPGPMGWGELNRGLPSAEVRALTYSPEHDTLSIATYGRSAFVTSLEVWKAPTVEIILPRRNSCGDYADASARVTFGSSVENPFLFDTYKFTWSIVGANIAPGETGTNATVDVILPSAGQNVYIALTVTFVSGFMITAESSYVAISPEVGRILDLVCRLRMEAVPVWFFDPLWDPLRAIILRSPPNSNDLTSILRGLERISNVVREALRGER
jgi:hypothetical protein